MILSGSDRLCDEHVPYRARELNANLHVSRLFHQDGRSNDM